MPTYDGNGNLTTDCTSSNTYAWDSDGNTIGVNLSGSAPISITYDAFDRAVEENNSGTYKQVLYSPIGKLALMAKQTANNVFLPLPGFEQATYTNSTIRFRHYDWLGSSRFESNMSEQEYGDVAYAPFGETYSIKNTPYLSFTGQNQDTTSGLYDFLYRGHSAVQGRWISPDPTGLGAVDPTNPQTWNRYAYVMNNPLALTDALGLQSTPVGPCPQVQVFGCHWWASTDPSGLACMNLDGGGACASFTGSFIDWYDKPVYALIPFENGDAPYWGQIGILGLGFSGNCYFVLANPCGAANNLGVALPHVSIRTAVTTYKLQTVNEDGSATYVQACPGSSRATCGAQIYTGSQPANWAEEFQLYVIVGGQAPKCFPAGVVQYLNGPPAPYPCN